MAEKINDPVAMWQRLLGDMETGFNAFANKTMQSEDFSRAMNQAGNVSMAAQKALAEGMERYLTGMNLPSRAQLAHLGERLQAIETQLHEIKALLHQMHGASAAAGSASATARPPRTRRPPARSDQDAKPPRRRGDAG